MQKHADPNYPIIIFFDGHGSHLTVRMIELARKCGVHLFCLPPHTTHKLQPLDVGIFGPLQRAWKKNCEEFTADRGRGITKPEFIKEYMKVRNQTFTPELIITAWRKTGLYPFNPNVFTELDYSPSQLTSTEVHYPLSFPALLTPSPSSQARYPSTILSGPGPNLDQSDHEGNENFCEEMVTTPPSDHSDSRGGSPEGDAGGRPQSPPLEDPLPSTAPSSRLSNPSPPVLPSPETLNLGPTPVYHLFIAQASHPAPPRVDASSSVNNQLVMAMAQAGYWQGMVLGLQNQLEMNNVHFAFSVRENDHLRKKLYGKSEPKEPRGPAPKDQARLLTTDEVMEFEMKRAAEKAEKENKRLGKQEEKLHQEAERARMRDVLGHDIRFAKPLKRMLRSELDDVIAVMSLRRDQKNIQECIHTIEAHVEKYPDLRVDPRFGRLFNGRYTTPPPPVPDNVLYPPPLPAMLYRFDTPQPSSIRGLESPNSSTTSPTSSSAPRYDPDTRSFIFPPQTYRYPPFTL